MASKEWFESMFDTDGSYDKWGHQYRITQKIRFKKSFNLIRHHIKEHHIISDVCCGLGDFLNTFNSDYLYGFDISNNAINKASKLYPNIHFEQNELPNIPKKSDIIIALECIYYINQKRAVTNIYNLLNNNGLFLVSVPIEYKDELKLSLEKFKILNVKYTYFGLFSKIEEKLIFYSKDLNYIIQRKEARNKFLLSNLLKSKFGNFIENIMSFMKKCSLSLLRSEIIVRICSLIPIKRHIIILAQKNE